MHHIRSFGWLAGLAFLGLTTIASAQLTGVDGNGNLYDVNTTTGATTNPRSTGQFFNGIAYNASGVLFGFAQNPNGLFTINPTTGATTLVGITGLTGVSEGDLCFDPTTNTLFGVGSQDAQGNNRLFSISQSTGVATILGNIGNPFGGDFSGTSIDSAGNLYVLDTIGRLLEVNKTNGSILSSVILDTPIGPIAGLAFDSSGALYASSGDGPNALYTINTTTGHATLVGNNVGLAGLTFLPGATSVPEPGSIALLVTSALTGAGFLARRRKNARKAA